MATPAKSASFARRMRPLCTALSIGSIVLGVAVLFGWHTKNLTLLTILPRSAPMHYNAALGFLACGAGLFALLQHRPQLALGCGVLASAVSALTLAEYLYGVDLGIDQLIMGRVARSMTSAEVRMAPNTALSFAFLGAAILTLAWSSRAGPRLVAGGLFSSTTVALGVVALFGYASGVETAYGWVHLSRMAFHEAAGFALLGVGVFIYSWGEGEREEAGTPRWLALPIGMWSATLVLALWMALESAMTRPPLPEVVLTLGLIMSALLAMTVNLSYKNELRSREVGLANDVLEGEIRERERAESAVRESNRELTRTVEELRHTQDSMLRQERLSTMGQMASGIAHDVNNALTIITGYCELMLNFPEHLEEVERTKDGVTQIHRAAEDAASVVKRLQELYRQSDEDTALFPLSINQIVKEVIDLTKPKWRGEALQRGSTITVGLDLKEIPLIGSDKSALREVLTNLIFNAVDAMPEGGALTIATVQDADRVTVSVADTGTGMTEEVRERCLDPFFTTKQGRGTGLGLSLCQTVVERFGGRMSVESTEGEGTTFIISFPIHDQAAHVRVPEASEAAPIPAALRILVVEDEIAVSGMLSQLLTEDSHLVQVASSGETALQMFEGGPYDLVITDNAMPGMLGEQLVLALKRLDPDVPVVMLTGFADLMRAREEHPEGVDCLIGKPVNLPTLRAAIRKAMGEAVTDAELDSASAETF